MVGRPKASTVDRQVGSRIRMRRRAVGLTQQQMAKLIGITYQQLQKYEKGLNRLNAGRLHTMALVLGTDIAFFFEQMESGSLEANQQDFHHRLVELTRYVLRIAEPEYRHAVCVVARAMADRSDQQSAELA